MLHTCMDYINYQKRLEYLKELLEKKMVETPKCISKRFDCSDKTARNMINRLREQGVEVFYCRRAKKYVRDF